MDPWLDVNETLSKGFFLAEMASLRFFNQANTTQKMDGK